MGHENKGIHFRALEYVLCQKNSNVKCRIWRFAGSALGRKTDFRESMQVKSRVINSEKCCRKLITVQLKTSFLKYLS